MIDEVLQRYGIELSEQDVADLLAAVFETEGRPASTGLSQPEAEFLGKHSGVQGDPTDPSVANAAVVERVRTELAGIARSLSTRELAAPWGVDGSRVRHRASEGARYAVRSAAACGSRSGSSTATSVRFLG